MPRKATGQVVVRKTKAGRTYALRFRAYGRREYLTLGTAAQGWDKRKAEKELRHVMADVERRIWQPPTPEVERAEPPTFHEFATQWMGMKKPELRPKTVIGYTWALSGHLLPYFADRPLPQITAEQVDRYGSLKLAEGKLGANQINKTLTLLSQILEDAVEYGHIDRNPARGKRRRVKRTKPQRSWVEPEQLPSLLGAADRYQRPLLATLAGSGLRVGEACALNWRDVNLATGTIKVREAKTDAGANRLVDLPLAVADELRELKARSTGTGASQPVFVNREGRRQTVANVERRIKTVIGHANVKLAELQVEEISPKVTPHSLRRTYASLRFALRDDAVYVAEQLGHTEATFSMEVYAKAVKRRERLAGTYREQFDQAIDWALMGTSADSEPQAERLDEPGRVEESAP